MAIAVAATRSVLSDAYKGAGTYIGLHTGDPGTTATPASEATGGSPAYARKQTTWGSSASGVVSGSAVTIDAAAGTYTYISLCSASSGNNMVDKAAITSVTLSGQGTVVVTPTYTQT